MFSVIIREMKDHYEDFQTVTFDDWNKMTLRPSVVNEKDFVLVNESLWNQLKSWFSGGPEINLFVINSNPDLNPSTVTFSSTNKGILISLQITDKQLLEHMAKAIHLRSDEIIVEFKNKEVQRNKEIVNINKTLKEHGITSGSTIFARKKESIINFEEEKDLTLSEEEMLRQAIEESLRDSNQEPISRLERFRPPNIITNINHTHEDNKEENTRPKTPSTGESTPTWKHKQAILHPVNNYQYLANIVNQ